MRGSRCSVPLPCSSLVGFVEAGFVLVLVVGFVAANVWQRKNKINGKAIKAKKVDREAEEANTQNESRRSKHAKQKQEKQKKQKSTKARKAEKAEKAGKAGKEKRKTRKKKNSIKKWVRCRTSPLNRSPHGGSGPVLRQLAARQANPVSWHLGVQ